jgi:hypothetical protein
MAVAAANLLATTGTATASSYNTASVNVVAGRLYLLTVHSRRNTAADAAIPTVTGAGQTWEQVDTHPYSAATRNRVTVFRCLPTSNNSGALTIDFGGETQTFAAWILDEFTGTMLGSNGANAIFQVVDSEDTGSPTSHTVTLAAFASASNATYGCGLFGAPATAITPGSGFTEMAEFLETGSTGNNIMHSEFKATSDTSVDWTFTAAIVLGTFGIEIAAAPALDDTGAGADDFAISNQVALDEETGAGADDLTVAQQVDTPLDQETGTGTDNLLIEAFTSLSTGRLVIGRFMTEEPGYTIADEIISHEQIDEGRMRPNIVMVDGEDDSWTEYDRADLLQRDTPVNAYLDLPELKSVGSVRQRAVEEQAAAQRSNSPGGEIVWDTHLNRLDRIYWVTENGIKYETRIEGLEVEFNQSMTPFQRASIDTGVVVLCPPEEEDTYLVRDLFERETANGIGDADTGGTWETY